MNGSAMLQVPHHGDRKAIYRPEFVSYRKDIEQRLGWMLANSVARIQHRFPTVLRCSLQIDMHAHLYME
jgi:hypothetical protein